MKYYKCFYDSDGFIYSLDMIRLNLDFGNRTSDFVNYIQNLNDYGDNVEVNYNPSLKSFQYRHLWTVACDHVSFCIGLELNNFTADSKNKGFVEFNPNKCENSETFRQIKDRIFSYTWSREVVRYDMAIDVPYKRESVKMLRKGKKNYHFMMTEGGITEYSGMRSHSGFIKVYDKTKESELSYDLTRIELTLDPQTSVEKVFPTIFLYDEQYKLLLSDDLSETQKVLIKAIRQDENPNWYYNELPYKMRKKIEPYLADKVLSLDKSCSVQVRLLAFTYT